MRERVLFAGNGFNCLDKNYVSWGELSERLFKKFGVYDTYLRLFVSKISPYMQYELLARAILEKNGKFDEDDDEMIRQEIAELTSKSLNYSCVHEDAARTYDQIITLNYDSCFENAALSDTAKIYPPSVDEKIAQLHVSIPVEDRTKVIEGCRAKNVWHAHGAVSEKGRINSLCMWFNTYVQNVAEIKQTLYPAFWQKGAAKESSRITKIISEIKEKGKFNGEISNWTELFFTSDVDIIGTELSYDELDVWWVLSCRSKIIREGTLKPGFNRIRYFMLQPYPGEKLSENKLSKIALLKSMDIKVVFIDPKQYFSEDNIFLHGDSDVDLNELANPPAREKLYNTRWYYRKCMSM